MVVLLVALTVEQKVAWMVDLKVETTEPKSAFRMVEQTVGT